MELFYSISRDEFSGNFRDWKRTAHLNHPLFGKQLGFNKVTQWSHPNSSYQELTIGIKRAENSNNGLVMVHLVGPDLVPRMNMLNADVTNNKEVESVARTMLSGLLYIINNEMEEE